VDVDETARDAVAAMATRTGERVQVVEDALEWA
jgi:hypothetical protein